MSEIGPPPRSVLHIYNSLSRRKAVFVPIDAARVRMYVCGMTVYDYCHIGHARVLVVFDVVYRYLCTIYGRERVSYVRNVTDIDDKIIARARANGEDIGALTGRFIAAMHEDAHALGVLAPNEEPRATLHMDAIITMIATLVAKGYAYCADNGDVYYDVSRFSGYGRLSGKKLGDLRAGARVEIDTAKADPLDFVLWKAAKPGEPSWPSPWGSGRPGWHIECSVMSTHCLGEHFDIHGGGMDLKFPHHENEIAQSEAATGQPFVNTWMHNGFVRVDDEKMSKSLGNFFTIREVLACYAPEVVRYFILTSHYRRPLNYSDQHLDNARAGLTTLYTALRGIDMPAVETAISSHPAVDRFHAAMCDDFNTPQAIAELFELASEVNRVRDTDPVVAAQTGAVLRSLGGLLGLLGCESSDFLRAGAGVDADGPAEAEIAQLIEARLAARANRDWVRADQIRAALKAQGIVLEDGAEGTRWRRQ